MQGNMDWSSCAGNRLSLHGLIASKILALTNNYPDFAIEHLISFPLWDKPISVYNPAERCDGALIV